jgi:mRNA interferase MazF
MAKEIARGEIWLLELPKPDRRRPVLVLSRASLLASLHTATVAAITGTLRGSPTEVAIGVDEGLKTESCVNLVNLFTVRKVELRRYVGSLGPEKMRQVCRALVLAVGCDG